MGDQPCPLVYIQSLGPTMLQWQSLIVATGNKAENIYYLALSRQFFDPWPRVISFFLILILIF